MSKDKYPRISITVNGGYCFYYPSNLFRNTCSFENWRIITQILERLRSRFFCISRELRTSRSHVTSALAWGLQFEVDVCTSRPISRGKWFTALQGFFHPKTSQSYVWEEILLLKTISLVSCGILFHENLILKTISQLKQKWTNEWKQTRQLAI